MKKKEYTTPNAEEVIVNNNDIIITSDFSQIPTPEEVYKDIEQD